MRSLLFALLLSAVTPAALAGFGVHLDGYVKSFDAKTCQFETREGTLTIPSKVCKTVSARDRAEGRIVSISLSMKEYESARIQRHQVKR
jgi:hypothetical protein